MKLIPWLQLAGLLHLGLVCAGASMPRSVKMGEHLRTLPPFLRRLFWVYYAFIGLSLVGFGSLTFFFAPELASGQPFARAVCLFLTLFWLVRLAAAAFVFDVRPYLTNWFYRAGYYATNFVFLYLVTIYAVVAWRGGGL